jgi:hypothetical protein
MTFSLDQVSLHPIELSISSSSCSSQLNTPFDQSIGDWCYSSPTNHPLLFSLASLPHPLSSHMLSIHDLLHGEPEYPASQMIDDDESNSSPGSHQSSSLKTKWV